MKCSIVKDILPLYVEKLTSIESNNEIEHHLSSCTSCAELYSNIQPTLTDSLVTKDDYHDALELSKMKKKINKKITKKIFRILLPLFIILMTIFFILAYYLNVTYPVTKENINVFSELNNNNNYCITINTEPGKVLTFNSKNEEIIDSDKNLIGQKITLYNLTYKNSFNNTTNSLQWEFISDSNYIDFIVLLENDQIEITSEN